MANVTLYLFRVGMHVATLIFRGQSGYAGVFSVCKVCFRVVLFFQQGVFTSTVVRDRIDNGDASRDVDRETGNFSQCVHTILLVVTCYKVGFDGDTPVVRIVTAVLLWGDSVDTVIRE